jgi:hypothetical protein
MQDPLPRLGLRLATHCPVDRPQLHVEDKECNDPIIWRSDKDLRCHDNVLENTVTSSRLSSVINRFRGGPWYILA